MSVVVIFLTKRLAKLLGKRYKIKHRLIEIHFSQPRMGRTVTKVGDDIDRSITE